MLQANTGYYCETMRDVDLIMSLLEKEGYRWRSGHRPRELYQQAPIIYDIDGMGNFGCKLVIREQHIKRAIAVKNIKNKIIAELRR